jgi:hypothetical protein
LEALLAERATLCWFNVTFYEIVYAASKDVTIHEAAFQQRKIDGAHRRFLPAVRTLAQVRKLALPAVRINVAKNQVNVASS